MSYISVKNGEELLQLLDKIKGCHWLALDTEFISEGRFRPELCLVQIATDGMLALIDAPAVGEMKPFWRFLADGNLEVLVHAGRSEMEFCYRSVNAFPSKVFDVQIAAGFVGLDYPAGFKTLLERILHLDRAKAETRTDWLKRPLSPRQIEYALDDVRYLSEMTMLLKQQMRDRNRLDWYCREYAESMERLAAYIEEPQWRNTTKSGNLSSKELAILRELWLWRDSIAKATNQVSARILRNDLIVELAKRKTSDIKRISEVRGLLRSGLQKYLPDISAAIKKALSLPPEEWPSTSSKLNYPHYTVRVQFLYAALNLICEQKQIATSLVGSQTDVRELIAESFGTLPAEIKPRLSHGWRAEIVGPVLSDLLNGRMAMRLIREENESPLQLLPILHD